MDTELVDLGWDEAFQKEFDALEIEGVVVPARVVRENRGQHIVDVGGEERVALLAGTFRKEFENTDGIPTVGDWVALEESVSGGDWLVRAVLSRRSVVSRQAVGKGSLNQLIASNMDSLFLVSGLDGDLNLRRIQRYLTLALKSGAQPVIVLNKADLHEDLELFMAEVSRIAMDVPIFPISAEEGEGLLELKAYFGHGKTVAMLGSSGVGKSTLVNALTGYERMETQETRDDGYRGRHTTTWRELIRLPEGGSLIDLPGMRELTLTGDEESLDDVFEEMKVIAERCRFRDCRHQGEPGCAIEAALESGELNRDRYDQYTRLKQERLIAKGRLSQRIQKQITADKGRKGEQESMKKVRFQRKKTQKTNRKQKRSRDFE